MQLFLCAYCARSKRQAREWPGFAAGHGGGHLTAQQRQALDDRKGEITQPAEHDVIGLEKGRRPAGGKLVKTQVSAPAGRILRQSLRQRLLRERLRERGGIHQCQIHALAELRAQRVRRIAEDGDALAVPLFHAHVVRVERAIRSA